MTRLPKDAFKWLTGDRRRVETALAIGILAVGGGVLLAYELLKRPADVHNQAATFKPQPPPKPKAKTVDWPLFGYNAARTRYLPAKGVKPPFRRIWRHGGRPLLEFPPVYADGKLFAVNNNGTAFALDADTGKLLWQRSIGRLNASSPTYSKHRLYIVNLLPGHVVKLDADTGRTIWKRWLPGRAESSPLVLGNTLYFGCENDQLFALSTRNGHERWATTLGGPVKSAPAYYHGILYVGDYGGHMNAVNAQDGQAEVAERLARAGLRDLGRVLLDPRRRLRARLRGQQRRTASTASISATGRSPGPTRPAATSTPARPWRGPGTARRPSTSAPSTATSTRSTRRAARPAGPLGRGLGDRLALRGRRDRLRGRVQQHLDQRLRS